MNKFEWSALHVAGTTVAMIFLVFGSTTGTVAGQPANDEFDDATAVTDPLPFFDFINTADATTDLDDPECVGQGPTVWYSYTAEADMRIEVNTFGSDYDTALSAYMGDRGDLIQIACNDDAASSLQSRILIDVLAGETYFFMVGAFASGPGGELSFVVQPAQAEQPPLTIDLSINPVGSFEKSGGARIRGTVTCSSVGFVSIFGELKQAVGRAIISGFFSTFVLCDGETHWEAIATSETGIYKGGKGKASAEAFAFDPETDDVAFDFENASLQLRGGPGRSPISGGILTYRTLSLSAAAIRTRSILRLRYVSHFRKRVPCV